MAVRLNPARRCTVHRSSRSPRALVPVALALCAGVALAGDAQRLRFELPPDVTSLEPGGRIEVVQVVGIDADGARVGLDGVTPEVTATAGAVASVEPPYRFAYAAPARIDGPLTVTLEARLPARPEVRGTLRLDVLPPGRYVRLRVRVDVERVDWGGTREVEVRGETRDGQVVPVADRRVEVAVEGPGKVEFVRLGTYRYTAPETADDVRTATVRARLADDAAVHGEAKLDLGPPAAGGATPPERRDGPAEEGTGRPAAGTGEAGAAETPGKPAATAEEPADEADARPRTVRWPGDRLELTAWRVREADGTGDAASRKHDLPRPGDAFVAPEPHQRLRFVVLDETVTDVTAEARRTDAEGPRVEGAAEVRAKRNKAGKLTVVLDASPPEDGTPLHVTLLLRRATGEPSRDVVVLRRAEP